MQLIEYTPAYFECLKGAMERTGRASSLCHRPFVDYYYATRDWCKLYLFVADDQTIVGTIGVERMRFRCGSHEVTLGFATNFHASQAGVGGYLFMQWMKSCQGGIVFGGSPDVHRILHQQQWTYFPAVKTYYLNRPFTSHPDEDWWRVVAKKALRHAFQTKLSRYASHLPPQAVAALSVREEPVYTKDLLPRHSPFVFRFAPSLDYLHWRYNGSLSFVHYRLFRILASDISVGYVIINESPERLIVAQCDGEDASSLAYGVLLSLLEAARGEQKPRWVILTSCHPEMQQIYTHFGFKIQRRARPFALGALRRRIDVPAESSHWLINYDWGDNGLRAPFLDQKPVSSS